MVELTIGLPIFLCCLFGVFDVAQMCLGYSSIRTAVYNAARRGIAVHRPLRSAEAQAFESMFTPADQVVDPQTLTMYPFITDGMDATYYGDNGATGPDEIFRVEALAMAYAYRIIEQSTGAQMWPCTDKPGCVACVATRTADKEFRDLFCESSDAGCLSGATPNYKVSYLGLRCTYNVPISSTNVFFGWLPDYIQVSSTAYVSMADYPSVLYDVNY